MTKKQIELGLKSKLSTDARWAIRAVTVIYARQTESERSASVTIDANGIGFSGADAEILSSFALQIAKGRALSPKQMAIVFRKMPRYWKQISTLIADDKLAEIAALGASLQVVESKEIAPNSPNFENNVIAALNRLA